MATIKPIEGRSIHQIQSGQVIVDLCSVVKELVENSLDAGSTSLDIRFKNNGLESIEVQDNGAGISPEDYETIALKHYTSKLSTYDDLSSLDTFGFRGEALSSLCALSRFHIVTAQDGEAPKGTKLDFEESGKLKATSVAASPKGTTVAVEDLFRNLPVRRRELEKNIKREYGKVLAVLHAYACVQTDVKCTVSNQPTKGKKAVVFATKSNPTTKENIANVYGAKTLSSLIPLDLRLELQPTMTSQVLKENKPDDDKPSREVRIVGHISKPVFGEGRQTPDRQMFFVNSRPCGLPQIARAFNEVYKSYNITQSPFIFADLRMDTNSYDVNVSPDKRVIMLHDQAALLESLKQELANMFAAEEQTVPQSQLPMSKLPAYRPLTMLREHSVPDNDQNKISSNLLLPRDSQTPSTADTSTSTSSSTFDQSLQGTPVNLVRKFASRNVRDREEVTSPESNGEAMDTGPSKTKQKLAARLSRQNRSKSPVSVGYGEIDIDDKQSEVAPVQVPRVVQDFNDRIASQQDKHDDRRRAAGTDTEEAERPPTSNPSEKTRPDSMETTFTKVHPNGALSKPPPITFGDKTSLASQGSQSSKRRKISAERVSQFGSSLQAFAAPGSNVSGSAQELSKGEDEEADSMVDSLKDSSKPSHQSDGNNAGEGEPSSEASSIDGDDDQASEVDQTGDDSDHDYVDEADKKRQEEIRVQTLIRQAETKGAEPSQESQKRATSLLKGVLRKDATVNLARPMSTSSSKIADLSRSFEACLDRYTASNDINEQGDDPSDANITTKQTEEERLSLTISKSDFATMRIAGQFNLGFILAVRSNNGGRKEVSPTIRLRKQTDDLFIIDQHASSEIHTFSTLSASTTFPPQPLVQPVTLDLTAIEEEIILAHKDGALLHNGFVITMDTSGDRPVGRRCDLRALPTSKETVFDSRDLEELLSILADYPASSTGATIPRPSKHRRTLAMRACRSSIMVGKELSRKMMKRVVEQMGEIDRPWNCPHGRPTMRHLAGLGAWEAWREDEGLVDDEDGALQGVDWASYVGAAVDGGVGVAAGMDDEDDAESDAQQETGDEEGDRVAEEEADESDEHD